MQDFDYFTFARVLHIFGVVLWIGGVAFVATVLIPSLKRLPNGENRLALFERLEGRFAFQAKLSTLITGLSGLYMLIFMDAWARFGQLQFWWLHLMMLVWLLFTLVLFVLEPLFLHKWFHHKATQDSNRAFKFLHIMHTVLLSLSLLAIFGAVAGSHGFIFDKQQ